MAFPTTPLDVKVELQLAGVWTDVTSKVYTRSPIQITRGRQDEDSRAQPGKAALIFNNRGGQFSPRNPVGTYYGTIGRNTPVRVSARIGPTRLTGSATTADYASTPDSAALSITGDIDLRADVSRTNWTTGGRFINKGTAGNFSYILDSLGLFLKLFWSADGTTVLSATSTVPVPQTTGRMAVRATLDVDNGAAGRTITFYTAPTLSGTWTQLGDPVVQAGVTSIFDSTREVRTSDSGGSQITYALKILQGIGGTERANPDFTAQGDGATSFVDAAGNTWTVNGAAAITNRRYRFHGEISAWPQAWDLSGNDVWTNVEAAGILRRLIQGDPLQSAFQRYVLRSATTACGYWPMEDSVGSTTLTSGLASGPTMSIVGAPDLGSDETFTSSSPLLALNGASLSGYTVPYASTGTIFANFVLSVPAAGDVTGVLLRVFATGTAARWDITYTAGAGGALTLQAFDGLGTQLFTTGALAYLVEGVPASLRFQAVQNGANIDWQIGPASYVAGAGTFGAPATGTLNTQTVGAATTVQVNPSRTLDATVMGHLVVYAAVPDTIALLDVVRGKLGETAGRRIERLCGEEGIAFTAYGDLDQTVAMGAQRPLSLYQLLSECETADMGQVFESREQLGLAYRTRDSRQYQGAAVALAYGNLSELVPVEDDQATRNDVTVSRTGGSSARAAVDSGPLSTQAPPNGVGRYAETIEVNVQTDAQLADQAQWRVTEGTIDEARYPAIVANLERPPFTSSATKTDGALSIDHGDLITVSGLPAWLPPDTVQQHTIGQVETLGVFNYDIAFVCTPTTPAGATGLYDDGSSRYAASGSTLGGSLTSTATGAVLSIVTAAGSPLWTTSAADFPMDIRIAGEVITISGITGSSSPQTGTISSRSVNGVVKAQSAGAAIDIADLDYYSL